MIARFSGSRARVSDGFIEGVVSENTRVSGSESDCVLRSSQRHVISPSKVCSNIHGFVTNLESVEVEVWIAKVDLELSVPHKKLDSTSY